MYNLAFRYYESELHVSDENLALLEAIMTLPIEEAELLIEDELDQDGELDLRA
jgi:hypothetical protein